MDHAVGDISKFETLCTAITMALIMGGCKVHSTNMLLVVQALEIQTSVALVCIHLSPSLSV